MTVYLLDANVVVRFLTGDPADQAAAAAVLIARAEAGKCELRLTPWIVAEVVYVLTRVYKVDRGPLCTQLTRFLGSPGIKVDDHMILVDAIARFGSRKVDFADALLVAYAVATGVSPASFDRDLDKFTDVIRFDPQKPDPKN